jgi:hypothetical protein
MGNAVSPPFSFNLNIHQTSANAAITIRDAEEGIIATLSMENNKMASSQKLKKQYYL